MRIVAEGDRDVPAGEAGEVLLRGGSVMAGYLDDPEATANVLSPEGWLRTGDLGVIDEAGRLRIVGRVKDMFIVGGFNAYPAEIENALLRHPAIAAGGGHRHPRSPAGRGRHGVRRDVRRCATRADHRLEPRPDGELQGPRAVEIVDELPLNATGKVMKDSLRERVRRRRPPRMSTSKAETSPPSPASRRSRWASGRRAVGGGLLADWGADVIKVEPPMVDPMRRAFGSLGIGGEDSPNPAFAQDNRGKRSIVLDLRDDDARAALEELLATADVFLTNLRPDALDGLDLEPEATVERHPRLVYCSVSGYGLRGDDRNRPAYDIGAFWARSGLSVQLSSAEGIPVNVRGGIGDHISGLAALAGLLAAVLEQRQTGRGACRRGLVAADWAYVLGWDLSLQATSERCRRRGAALQPNAAHELVPDEGRPLALLHRVGGRPPHRGRLPRPRA